MNWGHRAWLVALALLSACVQQEQSQSTTRALQTNEPQTQQATALATVKLASWNLEWLTTRRQGLPPNVIPRSDAAFAALRGYADRLDGDIVAFQEVDGPENAARVFAPSKYVIEIANEKDVQRVGFAIRKGLSYKRNPDVVDLDPTGSLRRGVDVTVDLNGRSMRLLAVHLKSGCFDKPVDSAEAACQSLGRQLPALREWIIRRSREGVPFAIVGDFNRRFDAVVQDQADQAWVAIGAPDANLLRVTEGKRSQCWDGQYPKFIDHIVLDPKAAALALGQSFEQLVYTEKDQRSKEMLSDHCPISIELRP